MPHQNAGSNPAFPSNEQSIALFERALSVFPDGTTRATVEKDPFPRYIRKGDGAHVIDVDGNRLLDLNNNFTTLIHGHGFSPVIEAVERELRNGTCFANPTEHEYALAELICGRIPAVERIRFVNTGTEAVMFAIKAARAFTGRPGVARFEGAYHGAYDWAEAGQSGRPENWGAPDRPEAVPSYRGMPRSVTDEIVVLRINDIEQSVARIEAEAHRLACLLIDPMPSRAGLIALDKPYIDAISDAARKHGIVLISDEVLNLRQGFEGASRRYGIYPDLVTMGKIIGGGFPIGAIGGRKDIMEVFGRPGEKAILPQGGTFSANPISTIAGLESMKAMDAEAFEKLEAFGTRLRNSMSEASEAFQAPFCVTGAASLFRIHTRKAPPREYREAFPLAKDMEILISMQRHFFSSGIILPVGAAACLSTVMTDADIDHIANTWASFLAQHQSSYGIEI